MLLLSAAVAVSVAGASSPAGAAARCQLTAGTAPLVMRAKVAVYRTAARGFGARVYACWRPTGRTMLLHTNTGGAAVVDVIFDKAAVSGSVVAFHVAASGDHNYDYVRAFDVRTGAFKRASRAVRRPSGILPFPAPPTAIATNADGAIVWLADGKLRVTDGGGNRIVATTSAGPITGVSATATKAHWTQAGADHRARLSR